MRNTYIHNVYLYYYTYMLIIIILVKPTQDITHDLLFQSLHLFTFDYLQYKNWWCEGNIQWFIIVPTIINAKPYLFYFYRPGDTFYKIHISRSFFYCWMLLTCVQDRANRGVWKQMLLQNPAYFYLLAQSKVEPFIFSPWVCSPTAPSAP